MVTGEEEEDPFDVYAVVVNHEGFHSIWPEARKLPAGWRPLGVTGSRAECLSWIDSNWDMSSLWPTD